MKNVLITGGSRGIGAAAVRLFAKQSYRVYFLYEKNDVAAAAVSRETGAVNIRCDVADEKQVNAAFSELPPIDILINNAGITRDAQFYKMADDDFYAVIQVNLFGTYNMSKAVVPYMMERRYGKIASASSIACIKGNFGQSNYASSKAAIMSFTRSLGRELGKYGINVNAVAPGFIQTGMTDKIPPEIMKQKIDSIPLRRTGEVEDIAAAYLFLVSDEASFVNATTLIVDGGMH